MKQCCHVNRILIAFAFFYCSIIFNILITGMDKFTLSRPIFRASNLTWIWFWLTSGTQKTDTQNQSVHPIKKQLKTLLFVLYYLDKTCGFHF